MSNPLPVVRATEIGEYISHKSCERRFKLDFNNRQVAKQVPFAARLFNTLDPVLQEVGHKREQEWESSLLQAGLLDLTRYVDDKARKEGTAWDDFAVSLAAVMPGQQAFGREIKISGDIGSFHVEGRMDFVLLLWDGSRPRLRLVECKASRRDRTYHRIQVALYHMLVRQRLTVAPVVVSSAVIKPEQVECVVARISEENNQSWPILDLAALNLDMEEADIQRLLSQDGALSRILATDLDALDYQLDAKCDGCVFSVHCLPESARQRRLELLNIEPSVARALRAAGVLTIDDLATLDLAGYAVAQMRDDPGFTADLDHLKRQAAARSTTLPGGSADPDVYQVSPMGHTGPGQLPEHERNSQRLIRVYLSVDYDYSENRLAALAAHVTSSKGQIHTNWHEVDGHREKDSRVCERLETGRDDQGKPVFQETSIQGRDVVQYIRSPWEGHYEVDTGAEKQLIQSFFHELIEAIAEVAEASVASVHLYAWSKSEMQHLVEACSRAGSQLLRHLQELLGCRESLEQLIYSCLQEEVDRRYALGWTGRGLAVASSLSWFGRRYHWRRRVSGTDVDLDHIFEQDIFDFKTTLALHGNNWADPPTTTAQRHLFEIRSRFNDGLSAPYWRAVWNVLPDPDQVQKTDPRLADSIRRYNQAAAPGYVKAYLIARVQALRWIEEGIRFKNSEIEKPLLNIAELRRFTLGIESVAAAGVDFLRLDHHVKLSDWIADHLVPPGTRVPLGITLPVRDVAITANNTLRAIIDAERYGIDLGSLEARCTISVNDFVRLSPCADDPQRTQTIGQLLRAGRTCIVQSLDWNSGEIEFSVMARRGPSARYVLSSLPASKPTGTVGDPIEFEHATLDESPSDFIAGRVEERLLSGRGSHVEDWLDPENPQVPEQIGLSPTATVHYHQLISTLPITGTQTLSSDQVAAVLEGLDTRIQLLQGPPGTGKTTTTAAAILLRILARRSANEVVLVAAHTHTAVDTLLARVAALTGGFAAHAQSQGFTFPAVRAAKVFSSKPTTPSGTGIEAINATSCIRHIKALRTGAVLIIGGTTPALLKMVETLNDGSEYGSSREGFQAPVLIVDEASMMVFPHFLSLATLVSSSGEIMLAGDNRQLSPIVAHDWEHEDRPPTLLYQPFVSAYDAIQRIAAKPSTKAVSVRRSALSFTFRLPPLIRTLIARVYRRDDIELAGRNTVSVVSSISADPWQRLWQNETGLFLILHNERAARRSNELEVQIIERILAAAGSLPTASVAVMTPHRAQRSLLKLRLAPHIGPVDVIDTVERLQGGERPNVIVSATASDPAAISANVEFILNLNRANVAFSRAQRRLIVVCSESLLDHIPPEVEDYDSAVLWKSLRALCSDLQGIVSLGTYTARIFCPPASIISEVESANTSP